MYNTSEDYKKAIAKLTRTTKVAGTIELPSGEIIEIDDNDIMAGSLNVDNACVNNQEFELGAVYMGQLKLTIYTDLNRYTLYNAKIRIAYFLKLENDEFEKIDLGVYTINEALRSGNTISITAYDDMIKLNKKLSNLTTGTTWELFNHIIKACGVETGNTEEEINLIGAKYGNGDPMLLKVKNGAYDTYRDLLADLALTCGGFATINKNGQLVIKRFKEDSIELQEEHIKKSTVADYVINYTGVSAIIEENEFFAGEEGHILEVSSELWNVGLDEQKQLIINNIYEAIKDIIYIPCELDYDNDPALELGDEIIFKTKDGEIINGLIMKNNFTYKNSHKISAMGSNPLLKASQTKTSKEYNKINKEIEAGFFTIETYEGAANYSISSAKTRIVDLDIYTNKQTTAMIHGQCVLNVKTPDDFTINYECNDVTQLFKPTQTITSEGFHILNFYCPVFLTSTISANTINIYLKASGNNGTDEVATIKPTDINVAIYGSILGAEAAGFTGKITIEQEMEKINMGELNMFGIIGEFTKSMTTKRDGINETMNLIAIGGVNSFEIDENINKNLE